MNKKTIAIFAVCMVLVAALSVFTTLALLQDAQTVTNTFTTGDVKITLLEADLDENGEKQYDGGEELRSADGNDYQIFPSKSYIKDPQITNIGSEDAYFGARIIVKATDGNTTEDAVKAVVTKIGIDKLLGTDGLGANIDSSVWFDAKAAYYDDEKDQIIYTLYSTKTYAEDAAEFLFTTLNVSDKLTNDQIATLNNVDIVIEAYAVQTETFAEETDPALAALKAGFSAEFGTPVQG